MSADPFDKDWEGKPPEAGFVIAEYGKIKVIQRPDSVHPVVCGIWEAELGVLADIIVRGVRSLEGERQATMQRGALFHDQPAYEIEDDSEPDHDHARGYSWQ